MNRVLHIVGTMNLGGQETFIMNLYRNINKNEVQFDFVVHSLSKGKFEEEIERLGGKIYRVTPISKNIVKHCKEMMKIMKENKYIAVHRHTSSSLVVIDLLLAKFMKIEKRIVHSHNTSTEHKMLHILLKPILNKCSNIKLACGKEAGEWLFGKNSKYIVINNGIEMDRYKFSQKEKEIIVDKMGLKGKRIIGHVGRFSKQKNHDFLIDIFNEVVRKDSNFVLLLIGDGELKKKMQEKVQKLGIEKNVIFLGIQKNVNELLNAIDIIVFPSLYEGMPVTMIEAQANGIPIIMSDVISKDVIYNKNIITLKLDNKREWINLILKNDLKRNPVSEKLIKEYDIKNISKRMQKIYLENM